MAIKKEHRIFIAVVGLAVGALAVDRMVFNSSVSGTPRPAAANTPKMVSTIEIDQPSPDLSGKPTVSSKKLWNAFEDTLVRQPVEHSVSEETPQGFDPTRFRQQHRLNAVMMKENQGYAIIDGQTLRLGETVDGLKITAIEETAVSLESGDDRVRLELAP